MLERIAPLNVGTVDRIVRAVLGVGLLSLTIAGPASAWGYLGLVPLLTAAVGTCPLYTALGISTKTRKAVQA
jgi:hypothetical protein